MKKYTAASNEAFSLRKDNIHFDNSRFQRFINRFRPSVTPTKLERFVLTLAFIILSFSQTLAQQEYSGNAFTSQAVAPGAPAGAYSLSDIERVNLASGNLSVALPLLRIGGRGTAGYTMMLPAERKWTIRHLYYPDGSGSNYAHHYFPVVDWQANTPPWSAYSPGAMRMLRASDVTANCQQTPAVAVYGRVLSRIVFSGADGTQLEFYDQRTKGKPAYFGNCLNIPDAAFRGNVWATNGAGVTFVSDSNYTETVAPGDDFDRYPSGVMLYPDGTRYRIDAGKVSYIGDRNGNKVSFAYSTSGQLTSVTDSLGRVVTISNGVITFKGSNGISRAIEVVNDTLSNLLLAGQTLKSTLELFPSLAPDVNGNDFRNPSRLAYVKLPDNRQYKFRYNSYGDVARIELPTGGATEYDWDGSVVASSVGGSYVKRYVKERRLYPNGESGANYQSKTKYEYIGSDPTPSGEAARSVAVTGLASSANGDLPLTYTKHHFFGIAAYDDPFTFDDGTFGTEYQTGTYTADGASLLAKAFREYEFRAVYTFDTAVGTGTGGTRSNRLDQRLVRSTTTLADVTPNLVSKQEFGYDPNVDFNRQTDVYEYDHGDHGDGQAGAFKRRQHTDFLTTNPHQTNADYLETGIYIRNLPTETWVSSDAAGSNKVSRRKFEYDKYSGSNRAQLIDRANVVGYDANGYGTGNTKRGNLTAVTDYENAAGPTGAITSYVQYDVLGNVVEAIDAKGHHSTVNYDDNFGSPDGEARTNTVPSELQPTTAFPQGLATFAFPTSATNALNWVTGYSQFDYLTGQPVDAEDLHGVVSTSFYNDPLDRLTQMIAANNLPVHRRQTTIAYHDAVADRRSTTNADLNAFGDNKLKSESFYDGLGRTTETRSYENGGGYITTLREYDASGRVKRVTNPYRPLASEPQYWTETKYDALSRIYEVKVQDGTTVTTSYSGNAVTVTDQAGKTGRSVTNALGQLTRIDEATGNNDLGPVGSPNQATHYTYDTLGNMVRVQQGSQYRYFKYDSLGRLTRVRQPEQETNSALDTTGDPYNNQWTAGSTYDSNGNVLTTIDAENTTITNNNYDALNRPESRTYSDGTPTVTFTYDDAAVDYSKGKLTKVHNSVSISQTTEFDILGRPKIYQQITDGQIYQSEYQYNFSGALELEKYPITGRTVKYEFDLNGDLSKISGKKNTATTTEKTYADGFAYTSTKAIQKIHLGNGLLEAAKFNSRLQITELGLGVAATNLNKWKVNYDYGEIDDSNTYHQARNTGNIAKQTISFDGLAAPFIQSYKYDALNRLKEAKETSSGQQTWQQTFGYDRYGNRTSFSQQGGPPPVALPTINPGNNRFAVNQGYAYDKNGNVKTDPAAGGRTFTFNGDNKQTLVKDANNNVIGQYFYDGVGKRVKKVTSSETTIFVYSGAKLVAEYSTAPPPSNPTINYVMTDTLQSVRAISDASGNVTSRRDFMPFGEELLSEPTYRTTALKYGSINDKIRQKFTGYQKDEETQLDFAEARMYFNSHGRFTAVDPLLASGKSSNPQTFNRYVYVLGNPLRYTDPTGLQVASDPEEPFYDPPSIARAFSTVTDAIKFYANSGLSFIANSDPLQNANQQTFQNNMDALNGSPEAADALNRKLFGFKGANVSSVLQETTNAYERAETVANAGFTLSNIVLGIAGTVGPGNGNTLRENVVNLTARGYGAGVRANIFSSRPPNGAVGVAADFTTFRFSFQRSGDPLVAKPFMNSSMSPLINEAKAAGVTGARPRACCEFKAVNDLLNRGSQRENIMFQVIDVRTQRSLGRCEWCQYTTRGTTALNGNQ